MGPGGHHFITFYSGITRLVIVGMSVSVVITCHQKNNTEVSNSAKMVV